MDTVNNVREREREEERERTREIKEGGKREINEERVDDCVLLNVKLSNACVIIEEMTASGLPLSPPFSLYIEKTSSCSFSCQ